MVLEPVCLEPQYLSLLLYSLRRAVQPVWVQAQAYPRQRVRDLVQRVQVQAAQAQELRWGQVPEW